MESIQINGQKIWGPPSDWVGPPPPYGTEVYVKNIPDDVSGSELLHIFSTVGKVYQVRLPVQWNGVNKGFGFVRFTSVLEADAAIEKLHMCPIRHGRQIAVERSFDNTRLYLNGVPKEKSGEEIKSDLLTVVDNVKTVYAYPASENPSLYRGYAFAEFVCHRDAAVAKRILTQDVLFNLFEKKCSTSWAKPLPFLNKDDLKQVKILFMRNVPCDVKTVKIRMAVDYIIDPDTVQKIKRNKDYAFLTFEDHEAAERSLHKLKANPYLLGPNEIQMEWAIPKNSPNSSSRSSVADDDEPRKTNFRRGCYPRSRYSDEFKTDESYSVDEYQNIKGTAFSFPNKYSENIFRNTNEYSELVNQFQELQLKRSIIKGNNVQVPDYSPESERSYQLDTAAHTFTSPITEFRVPAPEECNREIRLNWWLQSLSQQQPSSPTLNKMPTWNECRQFPTGQVVLGL